MMKAALLTLFAVLMLSGWVWIYEEPPKTLEERIEALEKRVDALENPPEYNPYILPYMEADDITDCTVTYYEGGNIMILGEDMKWHPMD